MHKISEYWVGPLPGPPGSTPLGFHHIVDRASIYSISVVFRFFHILKTHLKLFTYNVETGFSAHCRMQLVCDYVVINHYNEVFHLIHFMNLLMLCRLMVT